MIAIEVTMKVLLLNEIDMENQAKYGTEPKETYWVWRESGIIANEVYTCSRYDEDKTILTMFDGGQLLIKEPFHIFFPRWQDALAKVKEDESEGEDEEKDKEVDEEEEDEDNG